MFKRPRIALMLGVAIAISIITSACGGTTSGGNTPTPGTTGMLGTPGEYTCEQGSITASGSTALAPLVKAVATSYSNQCTGATITVNLGGSKTGLANVEAGSVDIGNSDVPANAQTQSDLVDHQVAVVVFVVIINKGVGVTNLTTDQVKMIYSGKATNWKQVGGPDLP